ncbi:DUF2066 domain-containing protein [Psychromonas sp. 14N.309.X.WAT.B.A12]|uniref:DUF2066 domain-containing protein n=1 Tax=unclassified Psychromonas TaxID=2614957 RepID=UPI0025AEF639|nr:DUF2066 domain-containing protein [Psychromonas sp. 14N.309.X.WAT.B.A12]MDN2662446.1 DUF2066 domain-containing protein [Psychromonas sp. 14N.309.X.WAT.B.A12]
MKNNVLIAFMLVVSVLFSAHSVALPQISAYQGLVLAEGNNEAQLREQALQQVLVKVSGNKSVIKLDETQLLAKDIPSILAKYGYQNIEGDRYYSALFDKQRINQALIEMQQPIWDETRPNPLIWLVNENRQLTSDNMVNSHQDNSLSIGLDSAQLERGISANFPLVDLEDSLIVSVSDVSGRFYQTVAEASTRYDAEFFVLANLNRAAGEWQLKWELVKYNAQNKQSQVVIKQTNRGEKSNVMANMMGDIADYYAKQFAIVENNGERTTQLVNISNLTSLTSLMALDNILNNLNAVDSFEILSLSATKVQVLVTLKGSAASLENALNAQPKLQQDLISNAPFYYNWRQ